MDTLQAKVRDMSVKAKKLRREGLMTGSISGKKLDHSIALTMDENEVVQFMKKHNVGSKATVVVDGTEYSTIIKSADYDGLGHRFIDMTFQQLVADEKINATAEIFFTHEELAQGFLTGNVNTIEYKAYPADLVDKIEIDVSKYPVGANVTVADLDISKNDKIDVVTASDTVVLHVAAHQHMSAADEEMIEEEEAAEAAKED